MAKNDKDTKSKDLDKQLEQLYDEQTKISQKINEIIALQDKDEEVKENDFRKWLKGKKFKISSVENPYMYLSGKSQSKWQGRTIYEDDYDLVAGQNNISITIYSMSKYNEILKQLGITVSGKLKKYQVEEITRELESIEEEANAYKTILHELS